MAARADIRLRVTRARGVSVSDGRERVWLGELGLDEGAHIVIERALVRAPQIAVGGSSPTLAVDLPVWARNRGHTCRVAADGDWLVIRGTANRWYGAERAGDVGAPQAHAPARWGVAARGALVEAGVTSFEWPLSDRDEVWADEAARLYAQGAAAQWDPATAIAWDAASVHASEVEDAIVQIMTYLIENETAALYVPLQFVIRLHPHFREVAQLLALQAADEARHIEVFTRRARLHRSELGLSTVGGQSSLATLFAEQSFAIASFLLSVLGEGSFLVLLRFIRDHAPDPCTRMVAQLAAQDEARHVAFGLAHLARHTSADPRLRDQLAAAIERRHGALAHTAGLNAEVFDALVILAAGSLDPPAIRRGHAAVVKLVGEMDSGRRANLVRLGFSGADAARLSTLHTRNFM